MPQDNPPERPVRRSVSSEPRPRHKPGLKQRLASPMRWLHIYSSMFGLLAILFFSVTGITLNHPSWTFGSEMKEDTAKGTMPMEWMGDSAKEPAKLEIVEHLRKEHRVRGLVDDFTVDESECSITLKGPAYSADVFLDRESGKYEVTQRFAGATAFFNDLHKGRDSGKAWSLVIDISAILLIIVSLTGIALLLYIKRRRRTGLLSSLGGLAVLLLILWWCVP
ncbi:MAG: PepSY-associated TM helix domain-containing protein [Akkermansiaceae bacterium]|nr:PepSY-associated TM helix domain-containing protein [Akkermansiaceae bacterium]